MDEKEDQPIASDDGQASSEENIDVISDEDPTFLVRPEVRKGRLIGDELVRYEVARRPSFKRLGAGLIEATKVTQAPHSVLEYVKRFLIGRHRPLTRHRVVASAVSAAPRHGIRFLPIARGRSEPTTTAHVISPICWPATCCEAARNDAEVECFPLKSRRPPPGSR